MDADRLVAFLPFSFMRAFFAKASPPGSPFAIPAVALTLTNRRAIAVYSSTPPWRSRPLLRMGAPHLSNTK
jgi:hypothetical protein